MIAVLLCSVSLAAHTRFCGSYNVYAAGPPGFPLYSFLCRLVMVVFSNQCFVPWSANSPSQTLVFLSVTPCCVCCLLYSPLELTAAALSCTLVSFSLTLRVFMLFWSPRRYCGSLMYLKAHNVAGTSDIWRLYPSLSVAESLSCRAHF